MNVDDEASASHERQIYDRKRNHREYNKINRGRFLERARDYLNKEHKASETWLPQRDMELKPYIGLQFDSKWMCEQYRRAHTACVANQTGIRLHQTLIKVKMTSKFKGCVPTLRCDRPASTGMWKLNYYKPHQNSCLGSVASPSTNGSRRVTLWSAAYSAKKVARVLISMLNDHPDMSTKFITVVLTR